MGRAQTTYQGGSRFYYDTDNRDIKVPGVTSIIGMLPKQHILGPWSAKLVAEFALDNADLLGRLASADREGAVKFLKEAPKRYTSERGEIGSLAHDAFERIIHGEELGAIDPRNTQHVAHFRRFLADVNPELVQSENVAWSDTHGYARSFDALMYVWLDENGDYTGRPSTMREAGNLDQGNRRRRGLDGRVADPPRSAGGRLRNLGQAPPRAAIGATAQPARRLIAALLALEMRVPGTHTRDR